MTFLVTGAAGYIGSVVAEHFANLGASLVAIDNLSQGHRAAIHPAIPLVCADLGDRKALDGIFRKHKIHSVVHLAASTLVNESMSEPGRYYHNIVVAGLELLDAMVRHGVNNIVCSSSCAVYGQPVRSPITEKASLKPVNPYGETKLVFERALAWYSRAYGISSVSLRYFNAAGASRHYGEDHKPESHLIPNIIKAALAQSPALHVYGNDYPTRDGTCIRDYVHVQDIARAHSLAFEFLARRPGCHAFNLGTGHGFTILEVIRAVERISSKQIPVVFKPRREGDPPALVADASRAVRLLGWQAENSDIENIVRSAWEWHRLHPDGYRDGR